MDGIGWIGIDSKDIYGFEYCTIVALPKTRIHGTIVSLPIHEWWNFMGSMIGKYTSLMDPMDTLQGTNISHLWKRKIIFKSALVWDMLVSGSVMDQPEICWTAVVFLWTKRHGFYIDGLRRRCWRGTFLWLNKHKLTKLALVFSVSKWIDSHFHRIHVHSSDS